MKILRFQNLFFGLSAILLIGFGAPRFMAAVWTAAGDPIYKDLVSGNVVSEVDLDALIESREAAIKFANWPQASIDLGYIYYRENPTEEGIRKGITFLKEGLEQAPVNTFGWLRLANLQAFIPEQRAEAARAWQTSRGLGLHEPAILLDRIRVGALIYNELSEEQRTMLRQDAETAYENNRGQMRRYGRSANMLEWFKFLLRDPEKTEFLKS